MPRRLIYEDYSERFRMRKPNSGCDSLMLPLKPRIFFPQLGAISKKPMQKLSEFIVAWNRFTIFEIILFTFKDPKISMRTRHVNISER